MVGMDFITKGEIDSRNFIEMQTIPIEPGMQAAGKKLLEKEQLLQLSKRCVPHSICYCCIVGHVSSIAE
jgi:hypothetical protein